MSIALPLEQIRSRLQDGKLWCKGWGNIYDPDAPTCLHGAVQSCNLTPSEVHIIRMVAKHNGWGIDDNDNAYMTYQKLISRVPEEITDEMLDKTLGPQWFYIVQYMKDYEVLTLKERARVNYYVPYPFPDPVQSLTRTLFHTNRFCTWQDTVRISTTLGALSIRDLINKHPGVTQENYDRLTWAWRILVGKLHPDDRAL